MLGQTKKRTLFVAVAARLRRELKRLLMMESMIWIEYQEKQALVQGAELVIR